MRIGIIGAGSIGSTIGKLWIDAGHDVRFASRHPDDLQPLVARLGPHASAGMPADAAKFGEVVMIAVPLRAVPDLAREIGSALAGKVLLDTNYAYPRRDGDIGDDAKRHPGGSSAWAAARFPGARWVKAFNSVYYKTLSNEAHRKGDQLGIPLAGDDKDALDTAARLVRHAGFDPVPVGALARGRDFEPDTPLYNTGMSGSELRKRV